MVIKIDFDKKTVAIEEQVTFKQLEQTLKALFPKDYKEWKIETNVKFEITSQPTIIRDTYPTGPWIPYTPGPDPLKPWINPVWYGSSVENVCELADHNYQTMVVNYMPPQA